MLVCIHVSLYTVSLYIAWWSSLKDTGASWTGGRFKFQKTITKFAIFVSVGVYIDGDFDVVETNSKQLVTHPVFIHSFICCVSIQNIASHIHLFIHSFIHIYVVFVIETECLKNNSVPVNFQ